GRWPLGGTLPVACDVVARHRTEPCVPIEPGHLDAGAVGWAVVLGGARCRAITTVDVCTVGRCRDAEPTDTVVVGGASLANISGVVSLIAGLAPGHGRTFALRELPACEACACAVGAVEDAVVGQRAGPEPEVHAPLIQCA